MDMCMKTMFLENESDGKTKGHYYGEPNSKQRSSPVFSSKYILLLLFGQYLMLQEKIGSKEKHFSLNVSQR